MKSQSKRGTECKTCRRRGCKCDKSLAEYHSCADKGIACEGYLFRWSGVASWGKLAGKSIPVVTRPKKQDWLITSVLYHTKSTPISPGRADQLLWPLLHAGLGIRDERRKDWLREHAVYTPLSGGFRDVQREIWVGTRSSDYTELMLRTDVGNMLFV